MGEDPMALKGMEGALKDYYYYYICPQQLHQAIHMQLQCGWMLGNLSKNVSRRNQHQIRSQL